MRTAVTPAGDQWSHNVQAPAIRAEEQGLPVITVPQILLLGVILNGL
jgi:hypothetical protein